MMLTVKEALIKGIDITTQEEIQIIIFTMCIGTTVSTRVARNQDSSSKSTWVESRTTLSTTGTERKNTIHGPFR